jgi:hypothetical protein
VAYVVGCVRGPLLTAVAFAAVLTVVGRLSLAFGFEAELLQVLGFGWAAVRSVASVRRAVRWLQARWRRYSNQ